MLKNHIRITLRNLNRYRAYSSINIVGLAIGIAAFVTILLFVKDELSYDRHHDNADRIYRLTRGSARTEETRRYANTASGYGPAIQQELAGVEAVGRFLFPYPNNMLISHADKHFYESGFLWADQSVFDIFSFPLVQGDANTALVEPNTIVITEEMAQKYFGDSEAMGQTLLIDDERTGYRVTGILENLPHNSHLQFDFLASIIGPSQDFTFLFSGEGAWTNSLFYTYVMLHDNVERERIVEQFPAFVEKHVGEYASAAGYDFSLDLQPVTDIHLRSHLRNERGANGDIRYVYIFTIVGVLILLIACVNFTNLATARAIRRAKEVGLRKVLGAFRTQLIRQFLGEALLLTTFSAAIALVLVEFALPIVNNFTGKKLALNLTGDPGASLALVAIVFLTGLLSGSYPAFFLSALQPVNALKQHGVFLRRSGAFNLRSVLVVFQFGVTIILLIATGIVLSQLEYLRTKNLGFEKEQLVVIPLRDQSIRENRQTIKDYLLNDNRIESVSFASGVPGKPMLSDNWPVVVDNAPDRKHPALAVMADHDYLETLQIELIAGRDFSEVYPTDATEAFVINETAVRAFGWASPGEALGHRLEWQQGDGKTGRIIGVVKDFHLRSLREPIGPMLIHVYPRLACVAVRIRATEMTSTLGALTDLWREYAPQQPFEYFFLDENFAQLYDAEERLGTIFGFFAGLAIIIACLGLSGLAAFATEQSTKEIGVRKVLGASAANIVLLLSKDFAKLVIAAFLLVTPIAYLLMRHWLENYAYQVDLGPQLFVLTGALALGIALLTVSFQATRAALANPVQALKYE